MKTVNGICYNLKDSDYIYEINDFTFYFSSKLYLNKFELALEQYCLNETLKLELNCKCEIIADEMFLLKLYRKIEKRGFRVKYQDKFLKPNYTFKVELI